jgi:hypothetical protein
MNKIHRSKNKKYQGRAKPMTTKRLAATAAMGVGLVAGGAGIASAASTTSTPPATHAGAASPGPRAMDPADCAGGVITAVSATSITVQSLSGASTTYAINSATTFNEGSTTITTSDLAVGGHVMVQASASSATTAAAIDLQLAELSGRVTALSGNSVTITDPQGFSRTIVVESSTAYTKSGAASSLSALTVGSLISARGEVDANLTSLDASSVAIGPLTGVQNGGSTPGVPGFASLGPMHQ